MHILGKTVEKWDDMRWEFGGSFMELGCESIHLLFGGDFRCEEKPDKRFKKRFSVSGLSRESGEHLLIGDKNKRTSNEMSLLITKIKFLSSL